MSQSKEQAVQSLKKDYAHYLRTLSQGAWDFFSHRYQCASEEVRQAFNEISSTIKPE